MYRNTIKNFKQKTSEGMKNSAFGSSEYGMDYVQMQQGYKNKFINVESGAIIKLKDPNPDWANNKDCGYWPCSGPLNVLYSFKDTIWSGIFPENAQADFQVIHSNKEFAPFVEECSERKDWNGYYCLTDHLAILMFMNTDWDANDRAI